MGRIWAVGGEDMILGIVTDGELGGAQELGCENVCEVFLKRGLKTECIYVATGSAGTVTPRPRSDAGGAQELGVGSCIVLWNLHTNNRMDVGCTCPIRCPHYPPMTCPYPRIHPILSTTTTFTQGSLSH